MPKTYPTTKIQPLGQHNPKYPCVNSKEIEQYINLPYEYLNPLQSDFLPYLEDDNTNVVVAAPTSSGKTLVAELFASRAISLGKKVLYIAPMKALADEKQREWSHPNSYFKKYKIEILTGDFSLTDEKKNELNQSDIIVLTPEMFNSKCRFYNKHQWLQNSVLIADECFPSDTKITIDDGVETSIKDVFENNKITHVMSYDLQSEKIEKKKILRKIKKELNENVMISFDFVDENNNKNEITCTPNHKIWVKNKGFIQADDIEEGNIFKNFNKYNCKVTKVKRTDNKNIKYVYNLEVEDNHNYFANFVLVSNCHLLGQESRGDSEEVAIIQYYENDPNSRSLFLSATLPNVSDFGTWLEHMTGRKSVVIENSYRPCKLNKKFVTFYGDTNYDKTEQRRKEKVIELIQKHHKEPVLVFVGSKRFGYELSKELSVIGINHHFHNADIKRKTEEEEVEIVVDGKKQKTKQKVFGREDIEEGFRSGEYNVLIASPTLAWGCFSPDTQVLCQENFYSIENIKNKKIKSFRNNEIKNSKFIKKIVTDNKIPMKRIILENGLSVVCTEDHVFPTQYVEKKAKNLSIKDKLKTYTNFKSNKEIDELFGLKDCFYIGYKIAKREKQSLNYKILNISERKTSIIIKGFFDAFKNAESFNDKDYHIINFIVMLMSKHNIKTKVDFKNGEYKLQIFKDKKNKEYSKVKYVIDEKKQDIVYDLSVQENDHHHYCVNGIVTHNCNTPARYVIISHTHYGLTPMDPADIIQEMGRAGRAGWSEKGDALILCKNTQIKKENKRIFSDYKVKSRLNDVNTLMFHILSYVVSGDIETAKDLNKWYHKTLASVQNDTIDEKRAEKVLENLKSRGMITIKDNKYKANRLGEITARMYMSPLDVSDWFRNFSKISKIVPHSEYDDEEKINLDVAQSLAKCYNWGTTYKKKDDGTIKSISNPNVYITNLEMSTSEVQEVSFLLGIEPKSWPTIKYVSLFYRLLNGGRISPAMNSHHMMIMKDIDRITSTLQQCDDQVGKKLKKHRSNIKGFNWGKDWDLIRNRIKYGVRNSLAEIIALPHIGKKRAEKLEKVGINTIEKFTSERNRIICEKLIGSKTYINILREIKKK